MKFDEIFVEYIKEDLKTNGVHDADVTNKVALKHKLISLEAYQRAARIIAEAVLERE